MDIVENPNNLKQALAFAARGWPVFPACYPNGQGECGCRKSRKHLANDVGKAPTTRRGFNDASTDEQVIQGWWGR